jgi:hypothetical protein
MIRVIKLVDYLYDIVYFEDEKRFYPTPEAVQELKRNVARWEGIDESMIIAEEC